MPNNQHHPSRRGVLRGAVWSTPAIVVATAAPAMAASGPALVTTTIPVAIRSSTFVLPVRIDFTNANTGSTGVTTVDVTFSCFLGAVAGTVPTNVSAGWVASAGTGDTIIETFRFTRATGIAGAPTRTSTAVTTLTFTVVARPESPNAFQGSITTATTATTGSVAPGSGTFR